MPTIKGARLRIKKRFPIATAIMKSGVKMRVDLREHIDAQIFCFGGYELNWVDAVAQFARNKTVLDCGAHIGSYSFNLCRIANEIHAFEPCSANAQRLYRTAKTNGCTNIHIIERAVSNVANEKLFVNDYAEGGHGNRFCSPSSQRGQSISTVTLDDYCKKNQVQNVGLIKIDVEGFELLVIRGALNLIRSQRPAILCELNEATLARNNELCQSVLQQMRLLNYSPFSLDEAGELQVWTGVLTEATNENVLFLIDSNYRVS